MEGSGCSMFSGTVQTRWLVDRKEIGGITFSDCNAALIAAPVEHEQSPRRESAIMIFMDGLLSKTLLLIEEGR